MATEFVLGRLDWSWGSTISADCRRHKKCKLMVTVKTGIGYSDWVQADLVKWLAAGTAIESTDLHKARGDDVKLLHGMKPRKATLAG